MGANFDAVPSPNLDDRGVVSVIWWEHASSLPRPQQFTPVDGSDADGMGFSALRVRIFGTPLEKNRRAILPFYVDKD